MKEKNTDARVESRLRFEQLEDWVREKIQSWVQELLEEEATELLGREKSQRRQAVDAAVGYRNGYGKLRRLTLSSGTITVRRPRVRNVERGEKRTVAFSLTPAPQPTRRSPRELRGAKETLA